MAPRRCIREFGHCVVDVDENLVYVVIPLRSFWAECGQSIAALRLAHRFSHNQVPIENLSGYDPAEENYHYTFRNVSGVVPTGEDEISV